MEVFLEQSVRFEEGERIYGTYVVNSSDPDYLKELEENETEVGYVNFVYDVQNNDLALEAVGCQKFAAANYQQLVRIVWSKIRMVQTYWNSPEYQIRKQMEEKASGVLRKFDKKKK
ncbi:MAG: hypothetical protein IJM79_02960 [Erysipelotrichaceae bacterium]|nr:hypothetical protein [Erysipelotrichaceae bacterium]